VAALALARRCGAAVIKRGAAGAVWSDGRETREVDTSPITPVDTTGAGDAFAAGWLAARRRGESVTASLTAANDLAAIAIGQVGARPDAG
jgi:ribokinase